MSRFGGPLTRAFRGVRVGKPANLRVDCSAAIFDDGHRSLRGWKTASSTMPNGGTVASVGRIFYLVKNTANTALESLVAHVGEMTVPEC